jgi:hypothetical protein
MNTDETGFSSVSSVAYFVTVALWNRWMAENASLTQANKSDDFDAPNSR